MSVRHGAIGERRYCFASKVCLVTLPALTRRSISVGEISILLDVPSSSDSVLEHSVAGLSENPYWGVLWDAAVPMARYLLGRHWHVDANSKALELGCGLGLTGICAWQAGIPVQMTDIVPEALQLAQHNARLNGIVDCSTSVLDWNQPSTSLYSLIFACDVLYERSQHAGLLKFLRSASHSETEIHIGDPGRQSSLLFRDDAVAAGFHVDVLQEDGAPMEAFVPQRFQVLVLRPALHQ